MRYQLFNPRSENTKVCEEMETEKFLMSIAMQYGKDVMGKTLVRSSNNFHLLF